MNINTAADIIYTSRAGRREKLFALSNRMLDRSSGTIQAAKLCGDDDDFRTVAARAARQIRAALRLQTWAANHARRGGL